MTELGIIEGYYGTPWTWEERTVEMQALAAAGYTFFLYAPKADAFLRKRWHDIHPEAEMAALGGFAKACKSAGVRFGVGLSPFEIYRDFGPTAKETLTRKLASLDEIGVQQLGIFFDDMRGDLPDLALRQVEILHWIGKRTGAEKLIVCPTYYSDDLGLDRFFGKRPPRYLEDLGTALDPAIDVFWTGEEVCSREYSPGHLARVGEALRRKPVLWDNYPVNDGPRMCPFLHLRAFTGRRAQIGSLLAGHAVNPALQPVLSRIPSLTLAESYQAGDDYEYGAAFLKAAEATLGADLARQLQGNLLQFNDSGLSRLGSSIPKLRERYSAYDHPGAREIVKFLDGGYVVTSEMFEGS